MQVGIAEVLLIAAGLVSILIVMTYRKDKDSGSYKGAMVLGVICGAALIAIGAMHYQEWTAFDMALIFIAGFAMVIRPFRKVEIAIIAAIVVMIALYYYLGTMTGDFAVLAEGTPRIIVAVVGGAFVYMILNFVEKIADLIGLILNLWPVLLILGIICIAEGALIIATGSSIFDYVEKYTAGEAIIASLL